MIRNPNPFTERQIRLLEAIRKKICQINDPDPEIITHESYEFACVTTKRFGKIPKIRFRPNSGQIKADIAREAGLLDETRKAKLNEIRKEYGIAKARNTDAMLFETEWDNIMFKSKKATYTAAYINQLFATDNQTLSELSKAMQDIIMDTYSPSLKAKREPIKGKKNAETPETSKFKGYKGYDEVLAEHK